MYTPGTKDASHGSQFTSYMALARYRTTYTPAAPVSTAWPTANRAFLIPFVVAYPLRVQEMWWQAGTTPGTATVDLGIYDDTFTRLRSTGPTAAVNTTDILQPVNGGAITPITLNRGRYYMAMLAAATTITVRAVAPANQAARFMGIQISDIGSGTLPATITPASLGTVAFIPEFGLTTITQVL